jgi:hypothetical protein
MVGPVDGAEAARVPMQLSPLRTDQTAGSVGEGINNIESARYVTGSAISRQTGDSCTVPASSPTLNFG